MSGEKSHGVFSLAAASLCLFFLGCAAASPRVEHYLLSPLVDPAPAAAAESPRPPLKIALRPISLPDPLNRPHIVVRSGETAIEVSEFHRWAGSLQKEIARVLVENLNLLLCDLPAVAATDELALDPDLVLALQMHRFDGRPGDEVELSAVWAIHPVKAGGQRVVRRSRIQAATEQEGYEGLALAHSRALAALSREIASAMRSIAHKISP